jgi:hypothetical protein
MKDVSKELTNNQIQLSRTLKAVCPNVKIRSLRAFADKVLEGFCSGIKSFELFKT